MVCLLHLFTTRARQSQGRMEQPLHKKIKKKSNFWDFYMNCFQLHNCTATYIASKKSHQKRLTLLLQEYENRYQKNILNDAKEVLNDHDLTLVEYFDYIVQEKQLNCAPRDCKEAKIMFETILDCSEH